MQAYGVGCLLLAHFGDEGVTLRQAHVGVLAARLPRFEQLLR